MKLQDLEMEMFGKVYTPASDADLVDAQLDEQEYEAEYDKFDQDLINR